MRRAASRAGRILCGGMAIFGAAQAVGQPDVAFPDARRNIAS